MIQRFLNLDSTEISIKWKIEPQLMLGKDRWRIDQSKSLLP